MKERLRHHLLTTDTLALTLSTACWSDRHCGWFVAFDWENSEIWMGLRTMLEDKLLVNDERGRWRGCALFKLLSMRRISLVGSRKPNCFELRARWLVESSKLRTRRETSPPSVVSAASVSSQQPLSNLMITRESITCFGRGQLFMDCYSLPQCQMSSSSQLTTASFASCWVCLSVRDVA